MSYELGLGDGSCGRIARTGKTGVSPAAVSPAVVSRGELSPPAVSPGNVSPITSRPVPSIDCDCPPDHPNAMNATITRATAAAMQLGLTHEHLKAAAAEVVGHAKAARLKPEAALMIAGVHRIAKRLQVHPGAFLAAAKIPVRHARAAKLVR